MGRCWESSKGENLLFSLLLKDEELINKYSCVSILSGTVILSVLKNIYRIDNVKIKWPNDVYINDKKACGILLEGVSVSKKIECVIVGIGINVNQKEFLNSNATSISLELKKDIFSATISTGKSLNLILKLHHNLTFILPLKTEIKWQCV